MANYLDIQKEETLKARVFRDYFDKARFAYDPNIGNIDFIVTDVKLAAGGLFKAHYLWAEAKKGEVDEISMLTQLVLTCKKTYDSGVYLPPPFIGCFDGTKIAFVPFHDILPVFTESDINWNVAPSNYLSGDFIKTRKKVAKLVAKNIVIFDFDEDVAEIKNFIRNNFVPGRVTTKSPITKNNFPHIYNRWIKEVKPTINLSAERWLRYKKEGILDCDFFRADMMSKDGTTITERLQIVLENDKYKLQKDIEGELFKADINFTDGGTAYRLFWNKYERPPAEEYQQYIIDRRDLLVPQNIREVKGSFFTPALWVEKSQEYIEKTLGVNWQDDYVIWDCAAGTGNLLAGLINKYNIWASTIDRPDVDTMHALIDEGLNLLHDHVFQFDFLNDKFDKLPDRLKKIIDNPEKRKKLIVYINPPYAESASAHGIEGKKAVEQSRIHDKYALSLGHARKELSAQFMARIYHEIPGCKIGEFSKLKILQSPRFKDFRNFFRAKLMNCFVVHANTFDNVKGLFPIGFKVWDTGTKTIFKYVDAGVLDNDGKIITKKRFWAYDDCKFINDWADTFREPFSAKDSIATLVGVANDFQQQNVVFFDKPHKKVIASNHNFQVTQKNLLPSAVYYAVRKCIPANWLNDRDQFLWPNDGWKNKTFQYDCLAYALFNTAIRSEDGGGNWIPFTEQEVDAGEKFESRFMVDFIKGIKFSREAKKVLNSGLELWRYYHLKIRGNKTVSVNASFYDIREFFQGRNENGKMNNKSADETYNEIIKKLRNNIKELAEKIEPQIYEYGFLK